MRRDCGGGVLSRLAIPIYLAADVERMALDFKRVTDAWVRDGWHSADEVAGWRDVIRRDMQNELSVDPSIDGRSRDERIRAWCGTWRDLARKLEGEK